MSSSFLLAVTYKGFLFPIFLLETVYAPEKNLSILSQITPPYIEQFLSNLHNCTELCSLLDTLSVDVSIALLDVDVSLSYFLTHGRKVLMTARLKLGMYK